MTHVGRQRVQLRTEGRAQDQGPVSAARIVQLGMESRHRKAVPGNTRNLPWARGLATTFATTQESDMSRVLLMSSIGACTLALAACGSGDSAETEEMASTAETMQMETDTTEVQAEVAPDFSDLDTVLAGDWRTEAAARDDARHPAETLEFLGIDPSGTIIEIWPGGGWYADVLAPWINGNGGTYVAAHFSASSPSENRQRSRARFEAHAASIEAYGSIEMADFGETSGDLVEPGSADAVLTFRNVHNWMMYGYAEKAFADFHTALKPGGLLGVVDHRLPSSREQDPRAASGYVQQAYVISLAEEAGFEFVGASEVNANAADTADHPFGVWTLPPVRRSAARGEEMTADFDRAGFDAIGESDRMTLLFRKVETNTED
jgi:predicted methyltransferase